ncbi:electron transfer flavoprotein subunit alpha/FixB family protein [Sulfurisphaera javensis]|uniref:Electron transfer flavoprotein subunit alpha/FixB family protein n=1 Tax=Sulfurisphaera javensis TaxID=2049879 RepID=A0AAT9GN41_9CREN
MKVVIYSEDVDSIKTGVMYFPNDYTIVVSNKEVKVSDELHILDDIKEEFIANYIASLKPDLVITGSSKRDKSIAGAVAGLLRYPIITDVTEISGNKAKRVVYSGMGIAEIEFSYPVVITVTKKSVEVKEKESKILKVQTKDLRVKRVEIKEKGGGGVDLTSAQIIVSVGRGIGSKENIKYAEELANALGAALGGSRPVTAELGWLPEDRQIGLSGNKVKPKLYIALGISGQPQHLAGIKDAKIIVAVNKDKSAPIVDNADYIIVGDAIEFCKVMADKVKKK